MKILTLVKSLVRLYRRLDRYLRRTLLGAIRYRWARLWVRQDEFHSSLEFDALYAYGLSAKKRNAYWFDLIRRRDIAHKRDLAKS